MSKLNYGKRFRGGADSVRETAKVKAGTFSDEDARAFANRHKPIRLSKAEQRAIDVADEARASAAAKEKYADVLGQQARRLPPADDAATEKSISSPIKVVVRRIVLRP